MGRHMEKDNDNYGFSQKRVYDFGFDILDYLDFFLDLQLGTDRQQILR
jgi:hypothetical protein